MKGIIYLVHAVGTQRYKIGFTAGNVSVRIGGLQVGSAHKLELTATVPGSQRQEIDLHFQFRKNHVHGEWFEFPDISKVLPFFTHIVGDDDRAIMLERHARELAYRVIGNQMGWRPAQMRRDFAHLEIGNLWTEMAPHFVKDGKLRRLEQNEMLALATISAELLCE